MTDEITIRSSLQVLKDPIEYSSRPSSFQANMTGIKGPCVGAIAVACAGTSVGLSELTTPAVCRIQNLDDANFVEVGIWDPEKNVFYPLLELLAGETYVMRLSRNLAQEYGTGTGTVGAETNRLQLRADTAPCNVLVEVFEA